MHLGQNLATESLSNGYTPDKMGDIWGLVAETCNRSTGPREVRLTQVGRSTPLLLLHGATLILLAY